MLRDLGVRVPLLGARGYSVTLRGSGTPPRHALYLAEAKLGLSPFRDSLRIAGVFELGASDAEAPRGVGERLIAAARPYLRSWRPDPDEPVVHIYAEGKTEESSLELEAELQALVEEIMQGAQAETESGASR